MSKWKIYDKEGNERNVEWLDGSNESVSEYTAPELEYYGSWMDKCFVTLSVKCHVPVDFEIGDYIIYRGEKFVINYNPSVIKKARKGTFGEGFTYDNIKFNALHNELTEIRFLDYVLDDNELHYTSLPEFPFYASSIDDYCDRLQANTNRWCKENGFSGRDYWLFVTPNYERTMQRARTVDGLEDVAREIFIREYGSPTTPIFDSKDEKHDVSVSVSSQSIWDSLSLIKSGFGLNFVNRGRAVVIGSAGLPTGHLFKYGKDKGLYEIERVADTEQMVLTKLYAYGSKENMPVRYYATLNQQVFATVTESKNDAKTTGYHFADLILNLPFRKDCFTRRSVTNPGSEDYPNYIVRVTANNITVKGYVSKDYNSDNCRFYSEYIQADDDRDETNQEAINAFTEAIAVDDTIYFVGGVSKDKFPSEHQDYATSNLPNNMAVSNLMLPGFPNQSLYDWVLAHGGTAIEDESNSDGIGRAKWTDCDGDEHEAFFSKEQYRPFILSVNYKEFGIREASKVFDGSDDTDEIKPTIEGTGFDVIYEAEMVEDNGVFEDGDDVPTIKLTLPDFGSDFLLDDLISQGTEGGGSPTISMRDGHCGGRSFAIKEAKRVAGGRWEVTCERDYDDLIQLYFPYSYAASHGETPSATEPYQVRKDDHFVLTGIPMTDTYIAANATKLLAYSLRFLEKNENTRYTYIPRIDELFMARQHDLALQSAGVIRSLHDSIKEGDLLQFVDEDLHIDGSVFIDQLTIKEYGNANIPTYDVTLRDEKQVGSIQRIENKINSIDSFINSGGGGLSVAQVRALINTYGGSYFLSKLNDDTASGLLTFLKGLKLGSGGSYGLEATGDGSLRDLVVRALEILGDATIGGALTTHDLTVTGSARFFELLIDEIRHVGGTVVLSHARMKTDLVMLPTEGIHQQGTSGLIEWVPSTDIEGHVYPSGMEGHVRLLWLADDGSRRTGNQFRRGDQVLCQQSHMLEAGGTDAANKYWWKLVIGASETPIDVVGADGTTRSYHWIEVDAASGLGAMVANAGDEVVALGWDATVGGVVTDTERAIRQSAIILASGFTPDTWNNVKAPCFAEYAGIDSFTLEGKLVSIISPHGNDMTGDFRSKSGKNYEEIVNNMSDGMSEHSIWFGSGQPTLQNAPAVDWTTVDVKKAHVGDLYFDTDEEPASEGGASWRFTAKNNNTTFAWERADDRYTVAALTKIQNVASDGIITGGMEKQGVLVRWNKAKADYLSAMSIAERMVMAGTEVYKKLVAAWHILYMYLNNAVDSDDTSVPPYQIKNEHIGESWTLYNNELRFTFESFLYTIPAGAAGWEFVWKTFDNALAAMLDRNGLAVEAAIENLGDQINLSVKRGDLEEVGMHLDDTDADNPHIDMVGNEIRTFPSGADRETDTPRFVLSGTELSVFNPETSQKQIRFGIVDGNVVMRYYDREGHFLYDLGPQGVIYTKSQDAEIIIQRLVEVPPAGPGFSGEPNDMTMMEWICRAVAGRYSSIKSSAGEDCYHVYTPVTVGLYPVIPSGTYSFKTVNIDTGEESTKQETFDADVSSEASQFSDDKWMSEVLIRESDGYNSWLLGNNYLKNYVYVAALTQVWLGASQPGDYTSVINGIRSWVAYDSEYENVDWTKPVFYREIRFYYEGVIKKIMKVFFNID